MKKVDMYSGSWTNRPWDLPSQNYKRIVFQPSFSRGYVKLQGWRLGKKWNERKLRVLSVAKIESCAFLGRDPTDSPKWNPLENHVWCVHLFWRMTSEAVDARNPALVEVGRLSHYIEGGLYTSQVVVWDFFHQQDVLTSSQLSLWDLGQIPLQWELYNFHQLWPSRRPSWKWE